MRVGVPKESKADEYRVSMLPVGVRLLVEAGCEVGVERGAGLGSGYPDADYASAGATLVERRSIARAASRREIRTLCSF